MPDFRVKRTPSVLYGTNPSSLTHRHARVNRSTLLIPLFPQSITESVVGCSNIRHPARYTGPRSQLLLEGQPFWRELHLQKRKSVLVQRKLKIRRGDLKGNYSATCLCVRGGCRRGIASCVSGYLRRGPEYNSFELRLRVAKRYNIRAAHPLVSADSYGLKGLQSCGLALDANMQIAPQGPKRQHLGAYRERPNS